MVRVAKGSKGRGGSVCFRCCERGSVGVGVGYVITSGDVSLCTSQDTTLHSEVFESGVFRLTLGLQV